jgi:hypothetical protein
MSTRSVIARKTKNGFSGAYHHWDGYPEGLGKTLFALRNGHFNHDTEAMLKFLIDHCPAGWSTINDRDFNKPVGQVGQGGPEICSGDPFVMTHDNASASGCEYAYVFDGDTMEIWSSFHPTGEKMIGAFGSGDPNAEWRVIGIVDLNGKEPNWESFT